MSFSRGTKGEVLWSSCSADVMDKLNLPCLEETSNPPLPENDHAAKYKNVPGTGLKLNFYMRKVKSFCAMNSAQNQRVLERSH